MICKTSLFPFAIFYIYYDKLLGYELQRETERASILHVILKNEAIENKDLVIEEMSHKTDNLSGSDLKELCRHAALFRVRDYISAEIQSG